MMPPVLVAIRQPMSSTAAMWQPLRIAFALLTRFPIPMGASQPLPIHYGQSLLAYPLVGATIGGLLLALAWLLTDLAPQAQAALLVATWAIATGGLHLDGLADTADAWVGGLGDREKTMRILKDPASGPIGVLAITLTLLVKYALVQELFLQQPLWCLLIPPVAGRMALTLLFITTPYARTEGMGALAAANQPRLAAHGVLIILLLPLLFTPGGALLALTLGALFFWARRAFLKRLGGFTGDTAGALCELTESAALLGLCLLPPLAPLLR